MFKKWIYKMINDHLQKDMEEKYKNTLATPNLEISSDGPNDKKCMNFKLYFANGGKILEIRKFDQRKLEYVSDLYIINEDENIGEKINKIIVIEGLR